MQEGVGDQFTPEQIALRDKITAYYEALSKKTDQPIPPDETRLFNIKDIIEEARECKKNAENAENDE